MDAQNAAELDQKKSPAGASPPQQSLVARSPKNAAATLRSASPKEARPRRDSGGQQGDRDSDAETIVLPGKDGHSPSKGRKVRHEDRSDGDGDASKIRRRADSSAGNRTRGHGHGQASGSDKDKDKDKDRDERRVGQRSLDNTSAMKSKRRLSTHDRGDKDKERPPGRSKDASSGLSSAPTSPPQRHRLSQRRPSVHSRSSLSDSENQHDRQYQPRQLQDKTKSSERLLLNKRKAHRTDSEDDEYTRKARRQRTTSDGLEGAKHSREHKVGTFKPPHESRNRSASPPPRMHRRSASSQLPSQSSNGAAPKKKRVPPPLQSTDYHSDESSASNSPHLRNAKLRSLATPASADANISPMKMASHKKHLDAHGQTYLARACARGEYDSAKLRLGERPEDLNVADYAGNTPLQIAAINGCEDIVKLLIDAGCNLDCVNYDKDTPLLDAVDNGHLGVVKLLLDAGVNPRKANRTGDEPIDRVTEETDNADEIRAALVEAKKRAGGRTKTSEDRVSHHDHDAPDSPRQSPAVATSSQSLGRRAGTVRSTKTRNDLLYMPLDDKTLRTAAGRGDEETVARVLQVKDGFDDPESMVAAARGGHDLVMQLLLGLGGANPDPKPVDSQPPEFATPMLAAIGQENIKVVELLLEQQSFDPTKRFKSETYYEVARRRQGTNWKEEEQILKNAYDLYKNSHKGKTKSPGRREREKEEKRARKEEKEERLSKRAQLSPSRDSETRRKASKVSSPTEKKKYDSLAAVGDDLSQKRGVSKPKKDDRPSTHLSDREASPAVTHKIPKAKRAESDMAAMSSDGEAIKPRRKLVSKGELRDQQRRPSLASNASTLKEPSSPRESRHEESSDKTKLSEKYRDRAKALKRGGSRDVGDGNSKRHRNSLTPDRSGSGNKDDSELPLKRRRLEGEVLEKRQKRLPSSDGHAKNPGKISSKREVEDGQDPQSSHRESSRKEPGRATGSESSVRIKSEDVDAEMLDAVQPKDTEPEDETARAKIEEESEKQKRDKVLAQQEAKRNEDRKRAEAEAQKKKQEEEAARKQKEEKQAEEEAKRKKEEEDRQAKRMQEEAEAEQRRVEEEKKRLAEEAARREEEERARKEAEERARLEEEKWKREEEERRRREEERVRKEREAAEEARRKREEEERKERERRERAHKEEMERKRAAREAEQRRIREEQERARLAKLPPLLRWLDRCPNPKNAAYVEKFKHIQGVRYDTICPEKNHTPEGREQWVLNTHAALLLGEKDLALSRYTSWGRAPVSLLGKLTLWRLEASMYTMTLEKFWDIGRQLPNYYGTDDPSTLSFQHKERLRQEAWERFRNMDMFFIKLSDLLDTVPNMPHLRNVKLAVEYRELMENESQAMVWRATQKWKQDPDANRFHGFAPRNKYYVNGLMTGEDTPMLSQTSKTPFPEERVPRRGLIRVFPDDPEYTRICQEQGLDHLVNGNSPKMPNGIHSPPASNAAGTPARVNGKDSDQGRPVAEGTNGIATNGSMLNGVTNAAH